MWSECTYKQISLYWYTVVYRWNILYNFVTAQRDGFCNIYIYICMYNFVFQSRKFNLRFPQQLLNYLFMYITHVPLSKEHLLCLNLRNELWLLSSVNGWKTTQGCQWQYPREKRLQITTNDLGYFMFSHFISQISLPLIWDNICKITTNFINKTPYLLIGKKNSPKCILIFILVTGNLKIRGFLHIFYPHNILCSYKAFSMQRYCVAVKAAKIPTNTIFVFLQNCW